MDDDLTEFPTRRVRLHPCQFCERQFNSESLSKHQAICRKVASKKRKVFDAGKQRATDSDVPYKATKRTMQIYTGDARAQEDRSKYGSKPNWREKHNSLIRSIREARDVTRAMKEGGPLPAFRPSDVPSDYVACPYCRRNFNQHAAKRHIPFCQAQRERKQVQPSRPIQQVDRGRTLPPQQSAQYQQQPYRTSGSSGPHDVYSNGYKHSNSAPMIVRRHPSDYQQPPPRQTSGDGSGWGIRKLFGLGSKQDTTPSRSYYAPEDEDEYEPPVRRPVQQPVMMRTGRTQENTSLNVRARQRTDDEGSYVRRIPPPQYAPQSYGQTRQQYENGQTRQQYENGQTRQQYGNGQTRQQYENGQYNTMRPTGNGRPAVIRCGECGSSFNNISARYCPQCGSRR